MIRTAAMRSRQTTGRWFLRIVARCFRGVNQPGVLVLAVALLSGLITHAAPFRSSEAGSITLVRKYRVGESTVYRTQTRTTTTIHTNPVGLEAFLPPIPTVITTQQQNTVKVRAIHPDGTVDVENHFDRFEMNYDLPERTPKELRDSILHEQQAFCRHVNGQTLVAHYDREGHLLRFEGAEGILESLSAPVRQPVEQVIKFFLEQLGGARFYPDHAVRLDEEWKRDFKEQPTTTFPWAVETENTYRYSGQTDERGERAAVIEFRFTNLLTPPRISLTGGAAAEPLKDVSREDRLHVEIRGRSKGQMLVALEGGRILENKADIHQALTGSLKTVPGVNQPASSPITVEMNADTAFKMEAGQDEGRLFPRAAGAEVPQR